MNPNPQLMTAIETQNYRGTLGDIAAGAGLALEEAQTGLLALASEAGGHLQVADSGEIVYLFPPNFRAILRNKYFRLRLQAWGQKVGRGLFYLLRISFGIALVISIVIMFLAILALAIAASSQRSSNNNSRRGNSFFFPQFFLFHDLGLLFSPSHRYGARSRLGRKTSGGKQASGAGDDLNFLEAVFSFLFGDGDPNGDLEERRWRTIAQVIRRQQGAVIAEQIAPYLDDLDEDEDYMLAVLTRFNGYPEVSPRGEIIYYFPQLQVTTHHDRDRPLPAYLQEEPWQFSAASSTKKMWAVGLGGANFVLALVLGSLLKDGALVAQLGGLVAIVAAMYPILLGYACAFLGVPLVRYFWLQLQNEKILLRNHRRQQQAQQLTAAQPQLTPKLQFAQTFAQQKIITDADITYSTEEDLLDQNLKRADKIDQEWRDRLGGQS